MSRKLWVALFFVAALPVVALADHQTRPGQPGYVVTLPRSCVECVLHGLVQVPGWRQSAAEVRKQTGSPGRPDDLIAVDEQWLIAARKAILQYQSKP